MNRPLCSPWPVVGLWLTWCCALLAYRLIPGTPDAVHASVYWVVMPTFYGLALLYGYRRREHHVVLSHLLRLGVLVLGGLAAVVLNLQTTHGFPAFLFYGAAVAQVSFGVVVSRERSLYGGLVISTLMLGFAASRPRSDTPLLLMALPFFACFVFTLVANQFSQARRRMAPGASRGGWVARATSGVVALLLAFLLGIGIVSATPMGGMGPMQWKLDRDFLLELVGGGGASTRPGNAGSQRAVGGQGESSEGVFAGTLRRELVKARTLGDAFDAVGQAMKAAATEVKKKVSKALQKVFDLAGWPWWLWLLLLLLPLLFHRVRLRLAVLADRRGRYAFMRRFEPTSVNVQAMGRSMDRLMELRGLDRPTDRTWSEHAKAAAVASTEGREWLVLFARQHDELRYRGTPSAASLKAGWPQVLHETYLAVYDTVRAKPNALQHLTRRQRLARTFAVLSPRQRVRWSARRARLRWR